MFGFNQTSQRETFYTWGKSAFTLIPHVQNYNASFPTETRKYSSYELWPDFEGCVFQKRSAYCINQNTVTWF